MKLRLSLLAILGLLLAVQPYAARAGLGGLTGKIKDKITDKTANEVTPVDQSGAYSPAVIGQAFNEDTLAMLLKGLRVMAAGMASTDSMLKRQQALVEQAQDLHSKHEKEIGQYDEAVRGNQDCRREFFEQLGKERESLMQQKAAEMQADPAKAMKIATELSEVSRQAGELTRQGDNAGAQKLMLDAQQKLLGIDLKADTAAAAARCGKEPAKPAFMVEEERLQAQADQIREAVRRRESSTQSRGVEASGISARRFALARERLLTWKQADAGNSAGRHFAKQENDLLASHRDEIRKVERALF